MKGTIFDIQRFSLHDGPGIRTTVFLKGCPLSCFWCHNPEGLSSRVGLDYSSELCISCGLCVQACPEHAISEQEEKIQIDREICTLCGKCVDICPSGSLTLSGYQVSTNAILKEVLRDQVFYELSGGGVTVSGGEPLQQYDFTEDLCIQLKSRSIHTAIESSLFCPQEKLYSILSHIDLLLFDLKHIDKDVHGKGTGVSNEVILKNIEMLHDVAVPCIARIPLIPGFNDDRTSLENMIKAVSEIPKLMHIEILPFHKLGEAKYVRLGLKPPTGNLRALQKKDIKNLVEMCPVPSVHIKY
jgi:pyruvate formate lyase activating enzyme